MKKNLDLEYLAIKLVLGIINEINFYKGFSNAKNVNISSFLKPWKKPHKSTRKKDNWEKLRLKTLVKIFQSFCSNHCLNVVFLEALIHIFDIIITFSSTRDKRLTFFFNRTVNWTNLGVVRAPLQSNKLARTPETWSHSIAGVTLQRKQ